MSVFIKFRPHFIIFIYHEQQLFSLSSVLFASFCPFCFCSVCCWPMVQCIQCNNIAFFLLTKHRTNILCIFLFALENKHFLYLIFALGHIVVRSVLCLPLVDMFLHWTGNVCSDSHLFHSSCTSLWCSIIFQIVVIGSPCHLRHGVLLTALDCIMYMLNKQI